MVEPSDSADSAPRGWHRHAPLAIFLAALVVFAATATWQGGHFDFWSANFASWHLATTGSPWIDGVAIPQLEGNPQIGVWIQEAPNGHTVVARSPGVVAAGLPAYWLAQPAQMTLAPGALTAAVLTAVSVLLVFLAVRTRLTPRESALVALLFGFATPVWTISADGLWPHTLTGVGIAGMAWAAATSRWWLVGVFGGITLWGRLHAAVIVGVLGLALGWRRREPGIVARVAVSSGAFLVASCVWSRWMYGSWDPRASYGGGVSVSGFAENHLSVVNHLGMWVSPDRGILVWTPVLVLLLPALVRSWREIPDWSTTLLLAGVGYTVLQSSLITFTGGDHFYGYRLGLEFLTCATPALAFAASRAGQLARALLGPVLALQTFAMLIGACFPQVYGREDRVWTHNALVDVLVDTGWFGATLAVAAVLIGLQFQHAWTRGEPAIPAPPPRRPTRLNA